MKLKGRVSSAMKDRKAEKGKHVKFDVADSTSSPTVFAEFVKKKDQCSEMSGTFLKKSKGASAKLIDDEISQKQNDNQISPKQNDDQVSEKPLVFELKDEKDATWHKKKRKLKFRKLEFFPETKVEPEFCSANSVLLGNRDMEFDLRVNKKSDDICNSERNELPVCFGSLNKSCNKVMQDTASLKQTKTKRKQRLKSKSNVPSKEEICQPSIFLKQKKCEKDISRNPQAEMNVSCEDISENKKMSRKKKRKNALGNITEGEMFVSSRQESDIVTNSKKKKRKRKNALGNMVGKENIKSSKQEPSGLHVYEETRSPHKLKNRSKEAENAELNISGGGFDEEQKNIFLHSKADPATSQKRATHKETTSNLSKKKKRKRSHSESSDIQVCEADGSLSADSSSKTCVPVTAVQQKKRRKKNVESHAVLSNQQTVLSKTEKGIFKQKKKFLQQLNLDNVSKTKKNVTKSGSSVNKVITAVPPNVDRKIKREKKMKKEQSVTVSSDKELHSGFCDENRNFRLDYGIDENAKEKKKRKKNKKFESAFEDVMQATSTQKGVITAGKISISPKVLKNTSVARDEELNDGGEKHMETESSEMGSSHFIKLHKKEFRGFEGREDTPERLSRTVFVGNLPLSADRKVLNTMFKNFGEIECSRLRCVVPTKASIPKRVALIKKEFHKESESLVGYVVFKKREDAVRALALNKAVIRGHHIRVDEFRKKNVYDDKRSVFVGNLPFNVTDESLWAMFGECGSIEAVRVVRDSETGVGKGFGFVLFEKRKSVKNALLLNETEVLGRSIRVKIVEQRSKPKENTAGEKQQSPLKIQKRNVQRPGWRSAGQKKTKKKLIRKKKDIQKKKHTASILTHE